MNKKLLELNGVKEEETKPQEEEVTIQDLVEALEIVTNIVLEKE